MPDDDRAQIQRFVDEALLAGQDKSVRDLLRGVMTRAKNEAVPVDAAVLLEYWWDLARTGLVAIPAEDVHSTYGEDIPQLHLTERGRRVLQLGEQSPHNPSRYLSAVRARVRQPDDISLTYLQEAVEAWRCGLHRSSAVMLGCACERLVLLLAESIVVADSSGSTGKLRKRLDKRVYISELFDGIRNELIQLRQDKGLPGELGDALDRKLSAVFDHARGLRNQSGHPTGEEVSAEDAEGGLLLFPGFYELVDRLINVFEKRTGG